MSDETKTCTCCAHALPITDFYLRRDPGRPSARRSRCRWCFMAGKDKLKKLLAQIKHRCRRSGIAFNLRPENVVVPERCPVLGMPLVWGWDSRERGYRDNSPSIDRLDQSGGYTADNIVVVSHRANRLRSDASVTELELIVGFYREVLHGRDAQAVGVGHPGATRRERERENHVPEMLGQSPQQARPVSVGSDRCVRVPLLVPPLRMEGSR